MKKQLMILLAGIGLSFCVSAQETLEQRIEKIPAKEKTPEKIIEYGIYLNDMEMFNHGIEKAGSNLKKIEYSFNSMDLNGGTMFLGFTPLMQAAAFGRTEMVKILLEKKVDVDATCKAPVYKTAANASASKAGKMKGLTALMLAAQNGHLEVIKLLLDTKTKFTTLMIEIDGMGPANKYSGTARQWAKFHNQTEAEDLIKASRKGAMGF